MRQTGWRFGMKSVVDRSIAGVGLLACSPLLIVIAVGVWLDVGWPVFFRQQRPGKHAKPFQVVKFRTMRDARDARGVARPDGERLTRFGRRLRALSLDELPQLWNVFCGKLSLVGPRPLLMAYVSRYTEEQARRHQVMPGITGWAQILGRNALTWEEKLALDQWYVENWSLSLDLRIFCRTLIQVLHRDGISNPGHATMPEFMGSQQSVLSDPTLGGEG